MSTQIQIISALVIENIAHIFLTSLFRFLYKHKHYFYRIRIKGDFYCVIYSCIKLIRSEKFLIQLLFLCIIGIIVTEHKYLCHFTKLLLEFFFCKYGKISRLILHPITDDPQRNSTSWYLFRNDKNTHDLLTSLDQTRNILITKIMFHPLNPFFLRHIHFFIDCMHHKMSQI